MRSLKSDKYNTVMADYMKGLLTNATPFTDGLERAGMKKLSRDTTLRLIQTLFDFDPVPALKKYNGPVLIIGAGRGPTWLLTYILSKNSLSTSAWCQSLVTDR